MKAPLEHSCYANTWMSSKTFDNSQTSAAGQGSELIMPCDSIIREGVSVIQSQMGDGFFEDEGEYTTQLPANENWL